MSNFVQATLNIPQAIYEDAVKNGYLEIVTRQEKMRYKDFTKCLFDNTSSQVEEALSSLVTENQSHTIKELRQLAQNINVDFSKVGEMLTNHSDKIQEFSNNLMNMLNDSNLKASKMSWLNAGLGITNIAATSAGFAVMFIKLEQISAQISQQGDAIEEIKAIEKTFNIKGRYQDLHSDAKIYFGKVASNLPVDHEYLEGLLKRFGNYLESMFGILDKSDFEECLVIIYNTLSVFTRLIISYYENYYGLYLNGLHPLHDDWMKIYERVASIDFRDKLRDFYFIDRGLHNREVNAIIDSQVVLTYQMISQMHDTICLLEKTESVEAYKKLQDAIDQSVAKKASWFVSPLEMYYSKDEAEEVVARALEESVGLRVAA